MTKTWHRESLCCVFSTTSTIYYISAFYGQARRGRKAGTLPRTARHVVPRATTGGTMSANANMRSEIFARLESHLEKSKQEVSSGRRFPFSRLKSEQNERNVAAFPPERAT